MRGGVPAHWAWPIAAGALALALIAALDLDRRLAHTFYDSAGAWPGRDSVWTGSIIHAAGGALVRAIGVGALLALIASHFLEALHPARRALLYFVLALAITNALVGLIKHFSNVECPWGLLEFGGTQPYVALLGDRADELPAAACFPAAHAASAYALVAGFFALREWHPRLARAALCAAIGLGLVFGVSQQSRGAHFLSHDVTSALIAWSVALGLYAWPFRSLLRSEPHDDLARIAT